MKFSINTQQDILNNWMETLIKRMYKVGNINLMPIETKYCIQSLNAVHQRFNESTKSTWGYLKSFVPFTTNYNYRVTYHNIVLKLCNKLTDLQTKISQVEEKAQQQKQAEIEAKKREQSIHRRSSAPAVLQFVYNSPINSFSHKKDKRSNSITASIFSNPFFSKRPTLFS